MRQLRKEQYAQQAIDKKRNISTEDINTENISLYAQQVYSDISDRDISATGIESADKMGYEELVVYFENELFNGVKTESDLQTCAMLADHGVTRSVLAGYVAAYPGDTVTALGRRVISTDHK
jgi:folate-dependent phosphoribosylglycinamide formyltransferase PurN